MNEWEREDSVLDNPTAVTGQVNEGNGSLFIYLSVWLCQFWVGALELLVAACGIQFCNQGLKPGPLHWGLEVLVTGLLMEGRIWYCGEHSPTWWNQVRHLWNWHLSKVVKKERGMDIHLMWVRVGGGEEPCRGFRWCRGREQRERKRVLGNGQMTQWADDVLQKIKWKPECGSHLAPTFMNQSGITYLV